MPGSPTLEPAKKSANWLVEGVAREAARHERDSARASSSRDRREPSSAGGEGRGASPFPAGETSESALPSPGDPEAQPARAPDSRDSRPADHAEKAPTAPNPLDRYLAAWMTPGDYAALQPSLGAGLSVSSAESGGLGAVSLPASLGGGLSGLALPGGPASPDALGVAAPAPSAPPRENPYLQTFTLPPAPAVGLLATPPPPAPSTLTPAPSPAPANPAPRPSVPDFARPAQDEKYFKQLKRF